MSVMDIYRYLGIRGLEYGPKENIMHIDKAKGTMISLRKSAFEGKRKLKIKIYEPRGQYIMKYKEEVWENLRTCKYEKAAWIKDAKWVPIKILSERDWE